MNMLKNNWTFVLLGLVTVFFLIMMLGKCDNRNTHTKWRYEVRGYVFHKGKKHEAIWFTDTLEFGENYVMYKNSDGSEVVIPPPFILIDHKYDSIDVNNRRPFR